MLKNPIVAAVICVIVVLASTVISVRARLNPLCDAIRSEFTVSGGIADQLEKVCDAGTGIVSLAQSKGLETLESEDLCTTLRLSIKGEPSSSAFLYQMLKGKLSGLCVSLRQLDLSEKEAALLEDYTTSLEKAQAAIGSDPYNSSVSYFLNRRLGVFSTGMARFCGVRLPEQFA